MFPSKNRISIFLMSCVVTATASENICEKLSPKPSEVTEFYENNQTYFASDSNLEDWKLATPESQGMQSQRLDAGAIALTTSSRTLSFLVLKNDALVYERYFNGSQINHSHNIHSTSKSLLGGLIGIAIREGYIRSIDTKIHDILSDEFSVPLLKRNSTVRQLLTMTSGSHWIEDETEDQIETQPNWIQAILNLAQIHIAGKHFNYSTGNTHLLSAVLTKASHLSTCDFAVKYLFHPVGIDFQHWGRDPQGFFSGGYNLYLTPRNLLKLGKLYLQNGIWKGQAVIPTEWIQQSFTPAVQTDHPEYNYGYLFWITSIQGHRVYKMWGHGGQFVYLIPDQSLTVVITTDTQTPSPELDGDTFIANYLLSK